MIKNLDFLDHPNSMDISATIKLSPKQRPKSQASNPSTNPGMNSILQDLVAPGAENQTPKVNRREPKENNSISDSSGTIRKYNSEIP